MSGEIRVRIQRYHCRLCTRSFILRKHPRRQHSAAFELEVVRRHVEGRESYRVIAQRVYEQWKLSASSLQRIVERVGERCKSPWEMSWEWKPRWDGVLSVDEKRCRVRGQQQWLYEAVDRTGDIVHCRGVKELTVNEAMSFLEEVQALGLTPRGIVTDLDTALSLAVEKVYPKTPHQYCVKHALEALEKVIDYRPIARHRQWNQATLRRQFERLPGRKGIGRERAREEFRKSWEVTRALSDRYRVLEGLRRDCGAILMAQSEEKARKGVRRVRSTRWYPRELQKKVLAFFSRHWDRLMMHHRVKGLPRTNNQAENLNKQLERRFKTIEAFQHRANAKAYVNLLIAYLRQKPYTDCRGSRKHLNGKSRLEAAGASLPSTDWLRNALKAPQNSNR